jgi:hypothetical protein
MAIFRGVFILLLLTGSAAAWQEPEDFRGIKWETTTAEAEMLIKDQWKRRREAGEIIIGDNITKIPANPPTDRVGSFIFKDKIGGLPVDLILYFLDDKFVYAHIFFKTAFFKTLEGAFKEKYGPPTSESIVSMQTRVGAKYEGKELKWSSETFRISLNQYSRTITDGAASIGKMVYLQYLMERDKAKRGVVAKDL